MNALIVSSSEKSRSVIAETATLCGGYEIEFAEECTKALQMIKERAYDLVIINGDSASVRTKQTALTAAAKKDGGVILIENGAAFEKTVMEVAPKGVIVIAKPLARASLLAAVQSVYAMNMRIVGLKEENRDLNKKLEDLKIIDRAKIALIQRLGYTESEAHKHIERQAMNLRVSKREVAVSILKTYEF